MQGRRNFLLGCAAALLALCTAPLMPAAAPPDTLLTAADAAKMVPDAVYFAGQSASTQLRNATGVHYGDGANTLAVLVDTSGYSTSVQQKYQGYLFTDAKLDFSGHKLAPGAYGIGFVKDHFVVMDIGNHDVLQASAAHDGQMERPMPLQLTDGSGAGVYRLCAGRECVNFVRAH